MNNLLLFTRKHIEGNVSNIVLNSANLMEITPSKEYPNTCWVKYWDAGRSIAANMIVVGTVSTCFTRV